MSADFDHFTNNELLDMRLEYAKSCVRDEKVLRLLDVLEQYRDEWESLTTTADEIITNVEDYVGTLASDIEECADGSKFDEFKQLKEMPEKYINALVKHIFEPMLRTVEFAQAEFKKR